MTLEPYEKAVAILKELVSIDLWTKVPTEGQRIRLTKVKDSAQEFLKEHVRK